MDLDLLDQGTTGLDFLDLGHGIGGAVLEGIDLGLPQEIMSLLFQL